MSEELKVRVSIGGYSGSDGPGAYIQIEDDASSIQIIDVRMTHEQFGQILSGRSMVRVATADVNVRDERIGKTREHKEVEIPIPDSIRSLCYGKKNDPKKVKNFFKPYEVDGWEANYDDAANGHRVVSHGRNENLTVMRIGFIRYV